MTQEQWLSKHGFTSSGRINTWQRDGVELQKSGPGEWYARAMAMSDGGKTPQLALLALAELILRTAEDYRRKASDLDDKAIELRGSL